MKISKFLIYGLIFAILMGSIALADNSDTIINTFKDTSTNENVNLQDSSDLSTLDEIKNTETTVVSEGNEFILSKKEFKKIGDKPFACSSPDAQKIAYLKFSNSENWVYDEIVVVDINSRNAKVLSLENVSYTSIMEVTWLNANLVAFRGHVNPSLDAYVVYDVQTGERIHEYYGIGFTWDADMQHVYYTLLQPFFSECRGNDKIMVDGDIMYESGEENLILDGPTLSNNGELLFFESKKNSDEVSLVQAEPVSYREIGVVKKMKWDKQLGKIRKDSNNTIAVETLYTTDTYDLQELENSFEIISE